ncbi:hypothetical protein ABT56_19965 [Photobacterium aquae]|uniref:Uncharacterized protein n=2 Tax=Photobacterium aquae TaxID=1195763 RepID=A0A0J1JMN0_9GAMM|nr:hypothetical protein ABT56_19965 [Photobacterium aquae]
MVIGLGQLYLNNTNDSKFPLGDFIAVHSALPSIFPIENLASTSKYDWIYQPSYTFFSGERRKNLGILNEETFEDAYGKGRFDLNPKVTLLKSGETQYFNPKIR